MSENYPCPKCGCYDRKNIYYTWWGGVMGPLYFNHVECQNCGAKYNSKTGKSNKENIIKYVLFGLLFTITIALSGTIIIIGIYFLTQ
jgi:hypothetical protein